MGMGVVFMPRLWLCGLGMVLMGGEHGGGLRQSQLDALRTEFSDAGVSTERVRLRHRSSARRRNRLMPLLPAYVFRGADQPDAQVRLLVLLGELRISSNAAAARRVFQEARQLAEERAPHLLRVIFDRWSHAAESTGDSEEALRLARRALETART